MLLLQTKCVFYPAVIICAEPGAGFDDPCGTFPAQDILWFFCPPLSVESTSVWYARKLWNVFSKNSQIPLHIVISSQPANTCSKLLLVTTATKLPYSAFFQTCFGLECLEFGFEWPAKTCRWTTQVFKENMGNPGWAEAEMSRIFSTCSLYAPAVNQWSLKNNLSFMSPLLKMSAVNSLRSLMIS